MTRDRGSHPLPGRLARAKSALAIAVLIVLAGAPLVGPARAQQRAAYRLGVIHAGGPFQATVEGLRTGLNESGLHEATDYVLDVRDVGGDLKAVEAVAQSLEREKVDLIHSTASSVTLQVKKATARVPVVFCVGTDPVSTGLVAGFAKPGGRLTGVHYSSTDVTEKRLELLKLILPRLRRVVTFYNPNNPVAIEGSRRAREAARRLDLTLIERQVTSVAELHAGIRALKPDEAEAFFYVADAMVSSQAQFILEVAHAKKLGTMFNERHIVINGALAGYGPNFKEIGRLSAKHVIKVLAGTKPGDLPVESTRTLEFLVNLRTAHALGLTIPPEVVQRVDELIR